MWVFIAVTKVKTLFIPVGKFSFHLCASMERLRVMGSYRPAPSELVGMCGALKDTSAGQMFHDTEFELSFSFKCFVSGRAGHEHKCQQDTIRLTTDVLYKTKRRTLKKCVCLVTDMRMSCALSRSLLLAELTKIPSSSVVELPDDKRLCRPTRPFQPRPGELLPTKHTHLIHQFTLVSELQHV